MTSAESGAAAAAAVEAAKKRTALPSITSASHPRPARRPRKYRAHVAGLMARLGAATRFQVALQAKERGWL
ncbi:hypothetical protein GCM10009663_67690 [Kitasatospora arboriphila]|uniref:Uncharacterized protein n=1 Tax=Kitasatospora arboriphila TaxID=258052 RepID=A0ABN1U4K4_9ACTN